MSWPTQTGHHVSQGTVIDVHAPLPCHAPRVDAQGVALVDVVINDGGQGVGCRGNGMKIAGEVKIDVFHGDNLCIAAASRTALNTHHWSLGGLTQGNDGLLAQLIQGVGKADEHGGLALAGGRGRYTRDKHQLALVFLGIVHLGDIDFGFGGAIGNHGVGRNACLGRNLRDWLQVVGLGNFNIGWLSSHDLSLPSGGVK